MATTLTIIGLVSSLFANINIPADKFAPKQHPTKTRVRIYAGLSGDASASTSGNIPGVGVWQGNGGFSGKVMGVYNYVIGEGKYYEHEIISPKASTEYVSINAFGKDALCVAAVSVTSPTGYQAGWLGDVGMKCGAPWYPSNLVLPGTDNDTRPACVWIDQDGVKDGRPNTAITIHLPSFTGAGDGLAQQYNNNIDSLCKSLPRFSMWTARSVHMTLPVYNPPLEFNSDGSDKDITKILDPSMIQSQSTAPNDPTGAKLGVAKGASALEPGPVTQKPPGKRRARRGVVQPLHNSLVISEIPSHSAKELCESKTSAGPDFVSSIESLFCDMADKTLWPLCSTGASGYSCFDISTKRLQHFTSELRVRDSSHADYKHVQVWS